MGIYRNGWVWGRSTAINHKGNGTNENSEKSGRQVECIRVCLGLELDEYTNRTSAKSDSVTAKYPETTFSGSVGGMHKS